MGKVLYAGPTLFAPMLKLWNDMVAFETERNAKKYYTYLLLTDGMNHDIDDTVEQVVISSKLPVSIVIIGVGNADFSSMRFLDADEQPLFCKKSQTFSKRDNVQFVEFNHFKDNLEDLTRETLRELPRQMVEYFMGRGMTPEDMAVWQEHQEARDFFSYRAMDYMSQDYFERSGTQDHIQQIVQEGIADPHTISIDRCFQGYVNNLK